MTLDELNKRFAISGAVRFEAGRGDLPTAIITARDAQAELMLHGAHLAAYQPTGQRPVIWMSGSSWFEPLKPIRGGVPICFPWFGQSGHMANAPGHGVVRLREWELSSADRRDDGGVQVTLTTQSDDWTAAYWPHKFALSFSVTVGRTLTMSLTARNSDDHPYAITEALHTYFAVSDVRQVKLHGLENHDYLNTVGGRRPMRQGDDPLTFAGETDSVFYGTAATAVIDDPAWGRKIRVAKSGSMSTVVWNPWSGKAAKMPDFGDDEWPGMLCVETANAGSDAITLEPGKSHTMTAVIETTS